MAHAVTSGRFIHVVLACLLVMPVAQVGAGSFVVSGSEAAHLGQCVEPTEQMRRNHMVFIRHQRDDTVHGGIRGTKHSLAGCVACHVAYDDRHRPIPIMADGQFCHACHAYTAVTLDCFQCHAAVPIDDPAALARYAAHGDHPVGVDGYREGEER